MAEEPRPERQGHQDRDGDPAGESGVVADVTRRDYHLLFWFGVVPFIVLFVLVGL